MTNSTILIIEDQKAVADLLAITLQRRGYQTVVASTAEDGLERLKSEAFDLLLLDYMLPGMNGLELLNIMQHEQVTIPVIVITARGSEDFAVQAFKLGIRDYLIQPIQPTQLVVAVEKLLPKNEIFVSYARADWEQFAKPVVELLKQNRLAVWVDQDFIQGGDIWLEKINAALKRCNLLVVCVSAKAMNSDWVKREYGYFLAKNKPMIPLICEETELPAVLLTIQHITFAQKELLPKIIKSRLNTSATE